MGFLLAGYPTRTHKRIRRISHSDALYCHHSISSTMAQRKKLKQKEKRSSGKVKKNGASVGHHINLSDFPPEIIQRIFLLSENSQDVMTQVNKYFYQCLRPTNHLMANLIWEKYSLDCNSLQLLDTDISVFNGKLLMNSAIFNNELLLTYFVRNYRKFTSKVSHFIPREDFLLLVNGATSLSEDYSLGIPLDLPGVFFKHFDFFSDNQDCLLELGKYFQIKNLHLHMESLLNWFFYYSSRKSIDELFSIIKFMMKLSESKIDFLDSPEPLLNLLQLLLTDYSNNGDAIGSLTDHKNISDVKKLINDLLERFISKFYASPESKAHLSHPEIWQTVQKFSDMRLIDTMIEHGANPQYDLFF